MKKVVKLVNKIIEQKKLRKKYIQQEGNQTQNEMKKK